METCNRFADSKLMKACKQGNSHAKQLKRRWHRRKHMKIATLSQKGRKAIEEGSRLKKTHKDKSPENKEPVSCQERGEEPVNF